MCRLLKLICLLSITRISYSCPSLQANPNVVILCSNSTHKQFNCTAKDGNVNIEIPTATTATYKCKGYYKPVGRRHKGGQINCTDDGTWTNQKGLQSFRCEFDCGRIPTPSNELISKGNASTARSWPWVATIFRQTNIGQFKYSCGGMLIGRKTVLTAAHCVTDERANKLAVGIFKVLLATSSGYFNENFREDVQIFSVKFIQIHQDYSARTFAGDIAILELNQTVIFSGTVVPICLPRGYNHDTSVTVTGNLGELASFGIDGTGSPATALQHAQVPIMPSWKCNDLINVIPQGDQFCGGDQRGPNICRGDSGSGLVFKSTEWNEEKYSVHGIVSNTGELKQNCAPLVIFTKVFSYHRWIEEQLISIESFNFIQTDVVGNFRKPSPAEKKLYTRAEIVALRKLLPNVRSILLEDYMHRDEYLIRFLRTKKLNIQEAEQMLRDVMEWRKVNRINDILKEDFTEFRKQFPIFYQGVDKNGRPVFVYLIGHWNPEKLTTSADCERLKRYAFMTNERTEARVRAIGAQNITQCIVIMDFHGPNIKKRSASLFVVGFCVLHCFKIK